MEKKARRKYNMPIVLTSTSSFTTAQLKALNPDASQPTIHRRIMEMVNGGIYEKVSHGVYRTTRTHRASLLDMPLSHVMKLPPEKRDATINAVIDTLYKQGVIGMTVDGKYCLAA